MKSLRNSLFALLALSVVGCGLSDYEKRMDEQRVRIQKFDDANQRLGDPIGVPTLSAKGRDTLAWPFDIYLRLPKGYVLAKEQNSSNYGFYRYSANESDYNVFVIAAVLTDAVKKEQYGEYSAARFRELVRQGIRDFYFRVAKYPFNSAFFEKESKLFLIANKDQYSAAEADLITPYSDGAAKILYTTTSYKDTENKNQPKKMEFRVYLHEIPIKIIEEAGKQVKVPGRQIAIVAQSPIRDPNAEFEKSIQAMLGTLDIGADVGSKRTQYKRLKGS